jgi:hypothetical protein
MGRTNWALWFRAPGISLKTLQRVVANRDIDIPCHIERNLHERAELKCLFVRRTVCDVL